MNKTQRRVMLKFLKQHNSNWSNTNRGDCDICYCVRSKQTTKAISLARYITKVDGAVGPYSDTQPVLCIEHARELSLVW